MKFDNTFDEGFAELRRQNRVGEAELARPEERVDPQLLAALHEGVLAPAEFSDEFLEACRRSVGTEEFIKILRDAKEARKRASTGMPTLRLTGNMRAEPHRLRLNTRTWLAMAASVAVVATASLVAVRVSRHTERSDRFVAVDIPRTPTDRGLENNAAESLNASRTPEIASSGNTDARVEWEAATVRLPSQPVSAAGVFLSADGLILTNYHAIASAAQTAAARGEIGRVQVMSATYGKTLSALIWRVDPVRDLALLKLETLPSNRGVQFVKLAALVDPDADCYLVSPPLDGNSGSIHGGRIVPQSKLTPPAAGSSQDSSLQRMRPILLHTDIPVLPSDSGDPLLNANGQLIGLTWLANTSATPSASAQHIALPELRAVAEQLPGRAEPVPFDVWAAGLTDVRPPTMDFAPASDDPAFGVLTCTYAAVNNEPLSAATVKYVTRSTQWDERSTGKIPQGLWGTPAEAGDPFDFCVVQRRDGLIAVGSTDSAKQLSEIRIGRLGSDTASVVWQRAGDGSWGALQSTVPLPPLSSAMQQDPAARALAEKLIDDRP